VSTEFRPGFGEERSPAGRAALPLDVGKQLVSRVFSIRAAPEQPRSPFAVVKLPVSYRFAKGLCLNYETLNRSL